jgi:hypothetical protein
MNGWIAVPIVAVIIVGASRSHAQDVTAGPGLVEVTLIAKGGGFVTFKNGALTSATTVFVLAQPTTSPSLCRRSHQHDPVVHHAMRITSTRRSTSFVSVIPYCAVRNIEGE